MAELQIQQEEKQRIFGAIPNYFVSYDRNAVPLTAKQKFELSFKTLVDPVSFGLAGLSAGVQQAQNTYPGYGPGAAGYGKRFGASYGDFFSGTMLGGAILPVFFPAGPALLLQGHGRRVESAWICDVDRGDR